MVQGSERVGPEPSRLTASRRDAGHFLTPSRSPLRPAKRST